VPRPHCDQSPQFLTPRETLAREHVEEIGKPARLCDRVNGELDSKGGDKSEIAMCSGVTASRRLQAKVDELLRVHGAARNELTTLDQEEPEEIERRRKQEASDSSA
jgi:hypothetical protein